VTSATVRLVAGNNSSTNFTVEGFTPEPDADSDAMYNYVGAGFLRTMGMTLLSGRDFTRSDAPDAPRVVIVNEAFLKKFNLGRDAVGKRVRRGGRSGQLDSEIVGIVRNSAYSEVKDEARPVVLFPYRQNENLGSTNFYVRTAGNEQELLAAIPRAIRDIDPTLPIADLRTMDAQIEGNLRLDRFVSTLSASFAALATLLAALGLYGVVTYTVTQRTREFGLRMALGAHTATIRRLVLRQVGLMTVVGTTIGVVVALALGRAAESLLFKMNARDPLVFATAVVVLVGVAFTAGLLPAQRAARVDPMTALRYE
jgi:predicted permease